MSTLLFLCSCVFHAHYSLCVAHPHPHLSSSQSIKFVLCQRCTTLVAFGCLTLFRSSASYPDSYLGTCAALFAASCFHFVHCFVLALCSGALCPFRPRMSSRYLVGRSRRCCRSVPPRTAAHQRSSPGCTSLSWALQRNENSR